MNPISSNNSYAPFIYSI